MQYWTDTKDFEIEEDTVVTLGKFDGRHRGHQKLLGEMMRIGRERGYRTAIFTFSKAPVSVVEGKPQTLITTNEERRRNLEKIGIDYLIEYPFTRETAHMLPEVFLSSILVGKMRARAIVVGTDCSFGYKGAGNARLLGELKSKYGYELRVIEKAQEDHRDISSTYVKEELDLGNIEKANELLGEPYAILGTVVHGNHIGKDVLGFPTANLLTPPEKHLPRFGVYVSSVTTERGVYGGITNIGRKPTVDGEYPAGVETYIYGLDEDLYGKDIEVRLLHFERPEMKFESLEELKNQIERDKDYGIRYLKEFRKSGEL